ncbi:MAG: site-specific DNA-methyltransferase [Sulfurimonas sp.]
MGKYEEYGKEELIKIIQQQEAELKYKKYGLVWDAEREPEQVVLDCENSLPILKHITSKTINTCDSEDNILIEGDNYHALSVLNYTHKEKIDIIYIDPPYNTGSKDFVYNDRFIDKQDSYRHSKWLNFMEKRLNLAKELLSKNGIIFISIDDNEVFNLKLLCDKVFSSKNFIANLPTIMNLKGNNDDFGFSGVHEYTLVYCKNKNYCDINHFNLNEDELKSWLEDDYGLYKKADTLKRTGQDAPRASRPKGWFPVFISLEKSKVYVTEDNKPLNETDITLYPINSKNEEMSWSWGKKKITDEYYNLIITGNSDKGFNIYKKQRPQLGDIPTKKPKTIFYKPEYSNSTSTNKLKDILGKKLFNTPKPIELIKDLIFLGLKEKSIILDFFAGSGTTGQAILELNSTYNTKHKFILCTNNENNICIDVTFPRVQKIIEGYKNIKKQTIKGLGGNLQYFKTSLLKKSNNRHQTKLNLTNKCAEMLCVKENIFNLEKKADDYKIYSSHDKTKYLCVYFNTIDDSFNDFIEELKNIEAEKKVYIFSDDLNVDKEPFKELNDCKIEAIPQKILDIYKQLIKMNIPIKPSTIFTDLAKAKKRVFTEKDKDDGAFKLRIVLEKLIQKIAQNSGVAILKPNGKEEKVENLNNTLKHDEVFSKVIWEENKTYMAIGNHAAHGDYDEYDLKQVENFYRYALVLIDGFNIG